MSHEIQVRARRLFEGAQLPAYQTPGSAGLDLCAYVACPSGRIELAPGGVYRISTGIALEIPEGFEAQVRPRSGLSLKGLNVALGTIDSDYRGEIQVLAWSYWLHMTIIHRQRIAQLVVAPVARARLVEVSDLSATTRGAGGFGSTGEG